MFHIKNIHKFNMADGGGVTMDSLGHSYTVTRWTDGCPEITTGLTEAAAEKMVAAYVVASMFKVQRGDGAGNLK